MSKLGVVLAVAALAIVSGFAESAVRIDAGPYPFDETQPRAVTGDAPSGWGNSCWKGPATGKSNYHVWYTDVTAGGAINLEDMFGAGHGLTIADLAAISFQTKKANSIPADRDWWLTVYTIPTGGDDSGSWFKSRLHVRPDVGPGYIQSFTYDAWNLWSTDAAASSTNQLLFYDSVRTPSIYETLAELTDGTGRDYSTEEIKSISIQTDSGWNGFDGLIDGLAIVLTDARVGEVDMVAAPTQVWVDDDYCDTCTNDGHIWGYDAFASVQAGIDAVGVGGTVYVAEGTYQENLATWKDMEITKSLSLIGAGSGLAIIELTEGKSNGVEIRGANLDVTLEGLTFTRAASSANASGFNLRVAETTSSFTSLVLRDVESAYASGRNVFIGSNGTYQNIVVENCSFHNSGAWGFSVRGTVQNLTIQDSEFDFNGTIDAAHGIGFDIDLPSNVQNISVSGGSFSNNTSKGINLVKTSNAVFSGLTASNNGGAPGGGFGVSLWEWHSTSSDLLFENCTFTGNSLDGFLFGTEGSTTIDDVTIACCNIQGNGRHGVLFYHNLGGTANNAQIVHSTLLGDGAASIAVSGMTNVVDAENNWWGTTDEAVIASMVSGSVDYEPWLDSAATPCGANVLWLNTLPTSLYIKPSEVAIIDMDALNLAQPVTGCQAVLNFSSTYFGTHNVNVAPGGGLWNELIYNMTTVNGDLDVAIGVDLATPGGTDADGTIAILTLTPTGTEGVTQIVFRSDVNDINATFFSDTNHQAVYPVKVDSQLIVIDGTPPVAFDAIVDSACTTGDVTVTFSTTDNLAGIDYYELVVDNVNQGVVTSPTALTLAEGDHTIMVKAYDKAGNVTDSSVANVSVDQSGPVISAVVAEQDGSSVLCPDVAIQGTVDIYVTVTDSGCAALQQPMVDLAGIGSAVYVSLSGDTYHYQVTVLATTANGSHTITVTADDALGNSTMDSASSLCVDKNQSTGTISMLTLSSASYSFDRDVVFVATDTGGAVLKTWTETVSFINDSGTTTASGDYTLTLVPGNTASLSAKPALTLRKKEAVTLDANDQAVVDFTVNGGDLNNTNDVNILDYSILKANWNTTNAAGNINGDPLGVQLLDYSLLKANWFTAGDAQ